MRLDDLENSDNVEDHRADSGGMFDGSGFGRAGFPLPLPTGGSGLGLGGMIVVGLILFALGADPFAVLLGGGSAQAPYDEQDQAQAPVPATSDKQARFVSAILRSTEEVWDDVLAKEGGRYQRPKLVLFSRLLPSACGTAQAAMGPFYCPNDRKVYLDMSFFDELARRFRAPGDFAQAYVIAHEVGHHVQNLLGVIPRVQKRQRALSQEQANALQVKVELQADCFAGVWANRAQALRNILEPGDEQEALTAASAIGDDRLQQQTQGHVVPESFTHGSSAQRVRWFQTGFQSGRVDSCDTFNER